MAARARRRIVIALVVLATLALLVLAVLRYGFLAGPVRAAVEARLSATIGQPVTIDDLRVSLFPRPRLNGTGIRIGAAGVQAPGIHMARIRVLPRTRSLFGGVIQIEEVLLDEFTVSVVREAGGGWRLPAVFPVAGGQGGAGVIIERVRVSDGRVDVVEALPGGGMRAASSIADIEAELVSEADGLRIAPLSGRIADAPISGEARVTASTVRLQFTAPSVADGDIPALLALAGSGRPRALRLEEAVSVTVTVAIDRASSRLSGKGTLKAPSTTVGPIRIDRLDAPFTLAGSRLSFAPATFAVSGGTHHGTVTLDLGSDPPRWAADSRLERLDTGALLDAVAGRDTHVDGAGRIETEMRGSLEEQFARTMRGRARLLVTDGVLRDFPLVATINRTLRLADVESRDTKFERLSATLDVAGAAATTDDLAIDAAHLRVTAAGRIGFDGALNLRGRATVSAERAAEAVARFPELARLRTAGEMVLPLTIAGTLDRPSFGVDVEAALKQGVRDELMRRLRRIIK